MVATTASGYHLRGVPKMVYLKLKEKIYFYVFVFKRFFYKKF
jgi:hypothetical protein